VEAKRYGLVERYGPTLQLLANTVIPYEMA